MWDTISTANSLGHLWRFRQKWGQVSFWSLIAQASFIGLLTLLLQFGWTVADAEKGVAQPPPMTDHSHTPTPPSIIIGPVAICVAVNGTTVAIATPTPSVEIGSGTAIAQCVSGSLPASPIRGK